jgi:hypothetical protein
MTVCLIHLSRLAPRACLHVNARNLVRLGDGTGRLSGGAEPVCLSRLWVDGVSVTLVTSLHPMSGENNIQLFHALDLREHKFDTWEHVF